MLILWLQYAFIWLLKLLIPPPPDTYAVCDPNARCPCCGNRQGKIEFKLTGAIIPRVADPAVQIEAERKALAQALPMLMHTCGVCGCRWGEPVISVPEFPMI